MSVLVSLTPSESKRLIAKGVAAHPLAKKAMVDGRIMISSGTTTGYVLEELTGEKIDIVKFPCGVSTQGLICQTPDDRIRTAMIEKGSLQEHDMELSEYEEISKYASMLGSGDVYIKGANAVDAEGKAGFLLAHPTGGNVTTVLPKVYAQGVKFIIPVGLEKLIPSVDEAQKNMLGINEYTYTFGRGCGFVTVNNGVIVNEITAIEILTGGRAVHVASGGIGGSEGAVTLVVHFDNDEQEQQCIQLLNSVKNEPALGIWKKKCGDCPFKCKYRFK